MAAIMKLPLPGILALLSTGYALSFFQRVYPSVLAPDLMKAFSLDAASFSLISSATMLGYAVTQIPSGLLADVLGGRRTLALYQIFAGVFCILFTFCDGLVSAVACRFILGLTLASNVPSYKVLAASVPANRYAMYCSILTGCGIIGTMMASSPLVMLTELVGWRAALLMVGIFTLILGSTLWLLLDDKDITSASGTVSIQENIRTLKAGLRQVVRMKNFWLIFIWFMFIIGNMFVVVTTWWGSYLMQANELSRENTGLSILLMSCIPLPFMLLFPWLSDNVLHSRRVFLLVSALGQALLLGWICIHRETTFSFLELTVIGILFTLVTNCMGPISFTMMKESVPASALASACGFLNCSAPIAAAVLQGMFGSILTADLNAGLAPLPAYADAFMLLTAGSVVALVATLFMKDTL
ncbi:MFS transporter [Mailhella massiliensis]|uniref:MFS transporter n=1 Tax=Mailhella massiliensis TaxID=1903261 RepID=UPI00097CFE69|nr:MFS transporter [Mailhella massiliensis]